MSRNSLAGYSADEILDAVEAGDMGTRRAGSMNERVDDVTARRFEEDFERTHGVKLLGPQNPRRNATTCRLRAPESAA